ncbi:MAG: sodium-dependent transporter, partial [Calditrichaeota bacterium]|nr:sodium-dependent transporter [Calditrichota bacterium]HQU72571.1 sodium-dependent transporter [Calditrichia bacterium]
ARGKALGLTAGLTAVLGLPSALSQDFFNNQDWVWGLGLILSGSFFAFAVLRKGVSAFRLKYLAGPNNDLTIGAWYDWIMRYLIPLEALAILLWWFYQTWNGDSWWNPTDIYSLGTCLVQWGTVLAILGIGNRKLYSLIEMEG